VYKSKNRQKKKHSQWPASLEISALIVQVVGLPDLKMGASNLDTNDSRRVFAYHAFSES
jgi:VIT1/CCC1 family predicted Fe2+/Mn2+ transporter